ncbi:hypothetical protein G5B30_00830 [Sphingobacterium sp. SGG-5]|uniref:DUF6702 family protein n=1 Tax=Sphingobacterium sp. SGG-5 TaxID=2710881 RepID=UPI0013E9BA86|nr:DUF6702 family protein [Sphingobacterium sp. SGG-5]NGM60448.1 hypothetical protein [Sphingobacterium sp. SGG-5]
MSAFFSKLLLLFALPALFSAKKEMAKHPFHVSTTEIAYNAKSKSLEITCRIFTDDFEQILAEKYKTKTDLYDKKREKEMNLLAKNYLDASIKFSVDGKLLKPNYIGYENDHEATNVYLEIEDITDFRQLNISNGILYDLFNDQMNIIHVEKNGNRKSTKVNFPEKRTTVVF